MGLIDGDHFNDGQCLELLGRSQIGRIGLSIGAVPAVVPVRYGMHVDGIVLACSVDQVAKAMEQAIIALQSDGFDEDMRMRWTVLAIGPTQRVHPQGVAGGVLGDGFPPGDWTNFWFAPHHFQLRPEVFSGRWLDAI